MKIQRLSLLCLLASLGAILVLPAGAEARKKRRSLSSEEVLQQAIPQLIGSALSSDRTWTNLLWLCDRIGHRLSGSPALDRAVAWGAERMEAEGLVNVHTEEVMVPSG